MDNPLNRFISPVARVVAILCGYGVLLLSFAIVVEIIGRKLFEFSLQGIDDIGGNVLAVTAAVGISYTLVAKGHVRIDVFLTRFPRPLRRFLNMLASVTLASLALFALWRGWAVLAESIEFQSTATNPLQTPLWIPQGLWVLGLAFFAVFATTYALHALYLYLSGSPLLDVFYGPPSARDELESELKLRRELEAGQ
ncbi:MAG: TRAP transporter small permease subunit [Acetobacteraceae bacterium]